MARDPGVLGLSVLLSQRSRVGLPSTRGERGVMVLFLHLVIFVHLVLGLHPSPTPSCHPSPSSLPHYPPPLPPSSCTRDKSFFGFSSPRITSYSFCPGEERCGSARSGLPSSRGVAYEGLRDTGNWPYKSGRWRSKSGAFFVRSLLPTSIIGDSRTFSKG